MLRPQRREHLRGGGAHGAGRCLLAGPALVEHGIDAGLQAARTRGALEPLRGLVYLGIAVAGLVLGRLAIILVAASVRGSCATMRNRVFGHLMSLVLGYFEREKTGRIVARMTSDIDAMQELVSQSASARSCRTCSCSSARSIVILVMSWQLALGILVIVPPVYLASRWFRRVSNRAYLEVRDRIGHNLARCKRASKASASCRRSGASEAFTERFREHQRGPVRSEHGDRPHLGASTSRSSSTPVSPAPR